MNYQKCEEKCVNVERFFHMCYSECSAFFTFRFTWSRDLKNIVLCYNIYLSGIAPSVSLVSISSVEIILLVSSIFYFGIFIYFIIKNIFYKKIYYIFYIINFYYIISNILKVNFFNYFDI